MRKSLTVLSLALLLLPASSLFAARLACNNASNLPNTQVTGFDFDVQFSSSASSGAGAGKQASTLTVQLPFDSTFASLTQIVGNGAHSASCVLSDNVPFGSRVDITMTDVSFTEIHLLNGPGPFASIPQTTVQLTLAYASVATAQAQ